MDTSFIMALILNSDSNYDKAVKLSSVLDEKCYINHNEVLTLTGRKLNIRAAKEIYYNMIDTFEIFNEYGIFNYNFETFKIFESNAGLNSNKTKLSFTDSSIILSMFELDITNLVSFDKEFEKVNGINVIGL